jgi:hypothetical protein
MSKRELGPVSDQELEKLFELINKAVNIDGLSANEKAELIKAKAAEFGSEGDLEEFLAMLEPSEWVSGPSGVGYAVYPTPKV